jgi:hypothetical protein
VQNVNTHHGYKSGKKIWVKLWNGEEFVDTFIKSTNNIWVFKDHGSVPRENIQSSSIYKAPDGGNMATQPADISSEHKGLMSKLWFTKFPEIFPPARGFTLFQHKLEVIKLVMLEHNVDLTSADMRELKKRCINIEFLGIEVLDTDLDTAVAIARKYVEDHNQKILETVEEAATKPRGSHVERTQADPRFKPLEIPKNAVAQHIVELMKRFFGIDLSDERYTPEILRSIGRLIEELMKLDINLFTDETIPIVAQRLGNDVGLIFEALQLQKAEAAYYAADAEVKRVTQDKDRAAREAAERKKNLERLQQDLARAPLNIGFKGK